MKCELSTYKLGDLLKDLTENCDVNILWKAKISGGFITMTGKVKVEYYPTDKVMIKGNNIISLNIINDKEESSSIKITGIKGGDFKVEIAPTKYKEIKQNSLYINKIQESNTECKLRIDENIIFTIPMPYDEVINKYVNY